MNNDGKLGKAEVFKALTAAGFGDCDSIAIEEACKSFDPSRDNKIGAPEYMALVLFLTSAKSFRAIRCGKNELGDVRYESIYFCCFTHALINENNKTCTLYSGNFRVCPYCFFFPSAASFLPISKRNYTWYKPIIPPATVNIPLGKNAPFHKIYFGAIIPNNSTFTQRDMKVYFRVGLFSCQCCKLLFANKRSSEPRTKPLTSEGTESSFNMNPATPLPATSIAHGYVTQKSYIAFPFLSSLLMLLLSFEDNTTSVLALIE